jgi:hypothetical protein
MGGMRERATSPILQAIGLVSITLLCGVYLAYWIHNPEIINRLGATLSALGAALVLYQTAIEVRNEKKSTQEIITAGTMSPADSEVARKIISERGRLRKAERIKIVAAIAIVVFIGELMHGWGDRVYRLAFGALETTDAISSKVHSP